MTMTEVGDTTNPIVENNLRREDERRARNDLDVMVLLLTTRARRSWLYRKIESCDIYGANFAGEETHLTAFRLGKTEIGKRLVEEAMIASPDGYMKMLQEAREDEARRTQMMREGAAALDPPRAEQQGPELPPPAGWPGHVAPATQSDEK